MHIDFLPCHWRLFYWIVSINWMKISLTQNIIRKFIFSIREIFTCDWLLAVLMSVELVGSSSSHRMQCFWMTFFICMYNLCSLTWDTSVLYHSQRSLNTLRSRQTGRHFADDIFKRIFLNENIWILIKISLKFVPKGPINNILALLQIMAWRLPGAKPLSEPLMVKFTDTCMRHPASRG